MEFNNFGANTTDRTDEEVEAALSEDLTEQIQEVLTEAGRTIGDLVQEQVRNSVTAASAYEIRLPGGATFTMINASDPRLQQSAPEGTTVTPKASAKAG